MATIPTLDTFTAGERVTAAKLNKNIRDAWNNHFAPPMISMSRKGAAQALTQNAWTKVTLDTIEFNNDAMWDATNQKVQVKTPGLYQVNILGNTNASGTGNRLVVMTGNDLAPTNAQYEMARFDGMCSSAGHSNIGGSRLVRFNNSTLVDFLYLWIYTTAPSASALPIGGVWPYLQLIWVAK